MIIEMFSYPFIVKALIVGALISVCCALLGITLVLKRFSMIGDGLSHVGFGALALASALNFAPLAVSLPTVIIAAFFLLGINQNKKIKGDSAIALVSTGALAIGVIIISVSPNGNAELSSYLFGSILALNNLDLYTSIILSIIVLFMFIFFYTRIFALTFDEMFSKAIGLNTSLYNGLTAVLTAVTIVLGMKIIGSLLISALIVFPALSAMRIFKTFLSVTIYSVFSSLICFFIGFIVSYLFELPTGATIVVLNLICFIVFSVIGKIKSK